MFRSKLSLSTPQMSIVQRHCLLQLLQLYAVDTTLQRSVISVNVRFVVVLRAWIETFVALNTAIY